MLKNFSVITNALVKNQENELLITQRSFKEEHAPGKWAVPGGKIELKETESEKFHVVEQTLKREVKEETGITISDYHTLVTNNTFKRDNGRIVLALVFLTELEHGFPTSLEETIAVKWIKAPEVKMYNFAPNVDSYLRVGFELLDRNKT